MMTQQLRVVSEVADPLPGAGLEVVFKGDRSVLGRVQEVMLLVAEAQAGAWPNDEAWRRRLPSWYVSGFETNEASLLADPLKWEFGSWLDAMRDPGWEWWSSRADGGRCEIFCSAHQHPYTVEPLEYLVRSAGGQDLVFREI